LRERIDDKSTPIPQYVNAIHLIDRTDTALAQPEPQGATDEEIDDQFFAHRYTDDFGNELMEIQQFRKSARAVLARFGHPANTGEQQ
jgi:hypothetical protein